MVWHRCLFLQVILQIIILSTMVVATLLMLESVYLRSLIRLFPGNPHRSHALWVGFSSHWWQLPSLPRSCHTSLRPNPTPTGTCLLTLTTSCPCVVPGFPSSISDPAVGFQRLQGLLEARAYASFTSAVTAASDSHSNCCISGTIFDTRLPSH